MKRAAVVIIENDLGNVLLVRRGRESRDEIDKWENPGGEIDGAETPEQAVTRELREELDCGLSIDKLIYEDSFTTDTGQVWMVTVFSGKLLGEPKIQNAKETAEVKWFAKNELKNLNLASYTRKDFDRLGWIK